MQILKNCASNVDRSWNEELKKHREKEKVNENSVTIFSHDETMTGYTCGITEKLRR